MRLVIFKDYDRLSRWVAHHIARAIIDFKPTSSKPFVLGLPTGSSPVGTYRELVKLNKTGKVSFKNVITFNMDEYVNLPESHPESYHSFMAKNLFDHIDLPKSQINILNGNANDLVEECAAYEEKIRKSGGINLFLGGVGADGHLAFNEPGSSLQSRTRVKTLTYDTIAANARFFNNDLGKVPKQALTVGIKTVTDAEQVVVIVNGYKKARALRKIVEEGINHLWTASVLQMHPRAIIAADEEAIAEMKVATVHYFRDIESKNPEPAAL